MKDMENMEHQGEDEDEDHVLTTMAKNPNKKKSKIKRMLIEAMATHEALAKFFESNFKKKCIPKYI
jgi:hypothetical protein